MLKDITLGQYFPGKSFIHRLDPRTKLVMLIVYIVALFVAKSWISYGVMLTFLVTCIYFDFYGSFKPVYDQRRHSLGKMVDFHHYGRGRRPGSVDGFPDFDADYRHLPADLYHLAHRID